MVQVWHAVLVEGHPQLLDVGGDARESVDPVDHSGGLDELGAVGQDSRNWKLNRRNELTTEVAALARAISEAESNVAKKQT